MASGTHAQGQGKLLDFEQYIDHQLDQARARIKLTDLLTSLVILVAGLLGLLFLEVVLDHIFGLPVWVRRLILIVGGAATAYFVFARIVRPLLGKVNGLYAARMIEEEHPGFKNSLISYLELRRTKGKMPRLAMAAVEAKAVDDLAQVEINTVVDQRRLVRMVYVLCALIVAFCVYAWLTPKSILDSTRRALLADVVRPTNTRLENIKPGMDVTLNRVVAGTHVQFSTEVQGTRPENVVLHYSADGGRYYSTAELQPGERPYDPWTSTVTNVQQDLLYYLTGGDAKSRTYRLDVMAAPMVASVSHDKEFPDYTGFEPVREVEGGNVEALEGTLVTVKARTNQPALRGELVFAKEVTFPMTPDPADDTLLVGQFRVTESGTYKILYETTGGQLNPEPVVHDIVAHKDQPPLVRIIRPEPLIQAARNATVNLELEAVDDFGVEEVLLHLQLAGKNIRPNLNFLENQPSDRAFKRTEALDLSALPLDPGMKLEYWLTARDNRKPSGNRAKPRRK